MTQHNRRIGAWGEQAAVDWLLERGYQIAARNIRTPYGEIDIIAKQGDVTVFVEVKTLIASKDFFPEHNITTRKREHMLACAEHYAAEHEIDHWQIDMIAIEGKPGVNPLITYFENAIQQIPLILLVGPTAVGKTEIAIQLAEKMNGEIVSADSRLFYRGMDIGTAKPSRQELARVPHHLIDIANPDETVSLAVFQQKATEAIADIHSRNKLPFLVGGTGQYIRAVTEGWTPPEVEPDERLRRVLEKLKDERGPEWLYAKLEQLDPEAAQKMDLRNVRRTIRALEVILITGRKFSDQRGQGDSPYQLITIGLTRPRQELYQRVDARIDAMFANGFVHEVQGLLDKGYPPTLPGMSAIGYRECVRVAKGEWTAEQAKVETKRVTRVFVRRQANWFKESDPQIQWFNPNGENVLEKIEETIRNSPQAPVL